MEREVSKLDKLDKKQSQSRKCCSVSHAGGQACLGVACLNTQRPRAEFMFLHVLHVEESYSNCT